MTEQHSIFTDICGLAEDEQLTVVIPAFNEEKTIGDVIRGVRAGARVLVTGRNNSSRRMPLGKQAGADVISHPLNKGNGACIKTALSIDGGRRMMRQRRTRSRGTAGAGNAHKHVRSRCGRPDRSQTAKVRSSQRGQSLFESWLLSKREIFRHFSGFQVFRHSHCGYRFLHMYPNGYSFSSTSTLSFITTGYNVCVCQ